MPYPNLISGPCVRTAPAGSLSSSSQLSPAQTRVMPSWAHSQASIWAQSQPVPTPRGAWGCLWLHCSWLRQRDTSWCQTLPSSPHCSLPQLHGAAGPIGPHSERRTTTYIPQSSGWRNKKLGKKKCILLHALCMLRDGMDDAEIMSWLDFGDKRETLGTHKCKKSLETFLQVITVIHFNTMLIFLFLRYMEDNNEKVNASFMVFLISEFWEKAEKSSKALCIYV